MHSPPFKDAFVVSLPSVNDTGRNFRGHALWFNEKCYFSDALIEIQQR